MVDSLGLKGLTVFTVIVLLKPAYEKLFPHADLVIITIAAFLFFSYIDMYFHTVQEKIYRETEENKQRLQAIEEFTHEREEAINNSITETVNKIDNTEKILTKFLLDQSKVFEEKAVDIKTEILKCVETAKTEMDNSITEKVDTILEESDAKQELMEDTIAENIDEREQLLQFLDYLTGKIDAQGEQLDNTGRILHKLHDKVGEEIKTETIVDKEGHTVLINTIRNNLIQYSELRENNKLSFIGFYKNGKIISSKCFSKEGWISGENQYYESGELKERKTYYIKNGIVEVKTEQF